MNLMIVLGFIYLFLWGEGIVNLCFYIITIKKVQQIVQQKMLGVYNPRHRLQLPISLGNGKLIVSSCCPQNLIRIEPSSRTSAHSLYLYLMILAFFLSIIPKK